MSSIALERKVARSDRSNVVLGYVIFIAFATCLGYFDLPVSETQKIAILSVALIVYNGIEALALYNSNRTYFFLNPIIIACVVNFIIFQGGITNLLLYSDGEYYLDVFDEHLRDNLQWVTLAMTYTCYANVAMWLGYKLDIGRKIMQTFISWFRYDRMGSSPLNIQLIIALAVVGYLLKVYLLSQGLYGRLAEESYRAIGDDISFLHSQTRFLRQFSLLPFTLICISYFKTRENRLKWVFLVTLLLELFFAFIYGARHPIVVVALIVALTYYYSTQKLNIKIVLPVLVVLYLAFTIVMEFKEFALATTERSVSVVELLQNFMEYRENLDEHTKDVIYGNLYENVVGRLNFVREGAIALKYDHNPGLQPGDPDFVKPLIMVPVDVFVPKFIQGKPKTAWGYWFKEKVVRHGSNEFYNIAFSAIGYLNFAGGLPVVLLGFFLYGILLRGTYEFLFLGTLGFLIFLALIGSIALLKTAIPSMMVGYLRILLIYPVIFYLLFARHRLSFLYNPRFWSLNR